MQHALRTIAAAGALVLTLCLQGCLDGGQTRAAEGSRMNEIIVGFESGSASQQTVLAESGPEAKAESPKLAALAEGLGGRISLPLTAVRPLSGGALLVAIDEHALARRLAAQVEARPEVDHVTIASEGDDGWTHRLVVFLDEAAGKPAPGEDFGVRAFGGFVRVVAPAKATAEPGTMALTVVFDGAELVRQAIARLQADSEVAYAQPNRILRAH